MQRPSIVLSFLLTLSTSLLLAQTAAATIIQLAANLDGSQAAAGAGTGSSATGQVSITLDDLTNEISWSGSFTGLGSSFLVAHFHGPALPNQNGAITVATAVTTSGGGLAGTSVGTATLTPTQVADLVAGLWYWNIHSSTFTGGEIRGNIGVVPEPGTAALLGLGVIGLALRGRRG